MKDSRDKITIGKHTLILSLVIVASLSVFLVVIGPLSSSLLSSLSPVKIKQVQAQQQPTSRPQQPTSQSQQPSSRSQQPSSQPQQPSSKPSSIASPQSSSNSPVRPGDLCNSSSQCPPNHECINGVCVHKAHVSCSDSSQCASGQTCVNGICVRLTGAPCSDTTDCPLPNQVCVSGVCVNPPATPGQCQLQGKSFCDVGIKYCADLQKDNENCGACGKECPIGTTCTLGQCKCDDPNEVLCPLRNQCTNVMDSDRNNCGACGKFCGGTCVAGECKACTSSTQCPNGEGCSMGICGPCTADSECSVSGQVCVSGTCVCPPGKQVQNGVCVDICPAGEHFDREAGKCVPDSCPIPLAVSNHNPNAVSAAASTSGIECNGQCVDTSTDVKNCGSCGNDCTTQAPTNTDASCNGGTCTFSCKTGFTSCNGQCVDTSTFQTDPNNCGACGNVCPSGQTCQNGSCQPQCPSGQTLCNGQCIDPNTAFQSDPKNCGACGNVCPPTTPACQSGQCVCGSDLNCPNSDNTGTFACRTGGDGLNACLQCTSDSQCLSGSYCVGSAGVCCPTGTGTCIGTGTTCLDFQSDPNHCGGCSPCSAFGCRDANGNIVQCKSCVNGSCVA
jgi:Stigma-specific protein, Stig1